MILQVKVKLICGVLLDFHGTKANQINISTTWSADPHSSTLGQERD